MREKYNGELPPPGSEDRDRWDSLVAGAREIDRNDSEVQAVADRGEQRVQRLATKFVTPTGQLRELLKGGMSMGDLEERLVAWRRKSPIMSLKRMPEAAFEALDKDYRVDAQQAALRRHVPVPADTMGRYAPSVMSDEEFEKLDERLAKRAQRDALRRITRR